MVLVLAFTQKSIFATNGFLCQIHPLLVRLLSVTISHVDPEVPDLGMPDPDVEVPLVVHIVAPLVLQAPLVHPLGHTTVFDPPFAIKCGGPPLQICSRTLQEFIHTSFTVANVLAPVETSRTIALILDFKLGLLPSRSLHPSARYIFAPALTKVLEIIRRHMITIIFFM